MIRWVIGIGVTVALLAWTLHGVSWGEVGHAMASADPLWIAVGLASFVPAFALRARRWGTLLAARHDPGRFGARHAAVWIGYAGNCLLPAHAGELARASALHGASGVPLGAALGTIVTERLLDVAVVFVFLLVPWMVGDAGLAPSHVALLGAACGLGAALLFVAAWRAETFARLAGRLARAFRLRRAAPKIERATASLLDGLAVLRQPRRFALALVESVALWICTAGLYWAVMQALGIRGPGVAGALFVQSMAAFGMAMPSTPGYFGPYEAAVRLGLAPYGVAPDLVVACALTLHALIFGTVTVVGLACAARLGLPLFRRPSPDTNIR